MAAEPNRAEDPNTSVRGSRHRSSAALLAVSYALVVVYASLYPFTGWRVGGAAWFEFVGRPLPSYWTAFDVVANWLGYLPLGLLVFVALVRGAWGRWAAFCVALLAGSALSFGIESLQNLLPQRVPSNLDWLLNSLGALLGAALGFVLHWFGGIARWQSLRQRWFVQPSAGGIALLLLWPVGLLFPLSFPFAMGQVLERAREGLLDWLSGTQLEPWAGVWLVSPLHQGGLTPSGEWLLIMLGLLAPLCLVLTVTQAGWRRAVLLAVTAGCGVLTTCLSTALSFGPDHAWAWAAPRAWWATCVAMSVGFLLVRASRRLAAVLGLMVLAALLALVTQAPPDPYFALSLQAWEQGRFIRFHGASQWVGWLWPYLAMAYLMSVVAGRHDPDAASG